MSLSASRSHARPRNRARGEQERLKTLQVCADHQVDYPCFGGTPTLQKSDGKVSVALVQIMGQVLKACAISAHPEVNGHVQDLFIYYRISVGDRSNHMTCLRRRRTGTP
jgi:hypothetical protein